MKIAGFFFYLAMAGFVSGGATLYGYERGWRDSWNHIYSGPGYEEREKHAQIQAESLCSGKSGQVKPTSPDFTVGCLVGFLEVFRRDPWSEFWKR